MTSSSLHRLADPRAAAFHYRDLGIYPLPIPRVGRHKDPNRKGWPQMRPSPEDLDQLFPAGADLNVGLLLGEPSGGLIDIDLDCDEAIAAAPVLLPATGWVSGRASKPRSHWWYRVANPPAKALDKYADLDGTDLLEFRSTGGQSVAPPGVHESGEAIVWHDCATPAEVDVGALQSAVRRVAVVALLARHWPTTGTRQDAHLALGGALLRSGFDVEEAGRLVEAQCVATGDEETRKRAQTLLGTAAKLDDDRPVTGWPSLAKLLGERGEAVVRRVREWLRPPQPDARRAIVGNVVPKIVDYRPLPDYRPFPLEALPPRLRDFVDASSACIGCDPALVAVPGLAATAGAIGISRAVLLKRGWTEFPILWGLTVGESGTHKTPAFRAATAPFFDLQMDLYENYDQALKVSKESLDEGAEEPPEPCCFVTSDATIESVAEILNDNPRGLLVARDELDSWFQSFTRYQGKSSDRPQWLELHGAGTLLIRRKTAERRRLSVRRAAASLCGTIQPGVLARALDAEAMQAGLGARFLVAMPPRRKRVWSEAEVAEELEERYRALLASLLRLTPEDALRRRAHVLAMSPGAKRLWREFYDAWADAQFQAEGEQASAFAKVEAYASRLALVHHVVSHVSAGSSDLVPLTETSMRAGITLAKWFAGEAVRVYSMLHESQEERAVRKLVEWVREQGGRTTVKQLQASNTKKYRTSEEAKAALDDLVALGLGSWEDEPARTTGGRRKSWVVLRDHRCNVSYDCPQDGSEPPDNDCSETDNDSPQPSTAPPVATDSSGRGSDDLASRASEAIVGNVVPEFPPGSGGEGGGQSLHPAEQSLHHGFGPVPFLLVTDVAGLEGVRAALQTNDLVGLDLETTGLDPRQNRVRLLSVAVETIDGGEFAYLIDCSALDPTPLWGILARKELVLHNAAFDLGFLAPLGFSPGVTHDTEDGGPTPAVHDTMLRAQLLAAGTHDKVSLAVCCERYLHRTLPKEEQRSDWSGTLSKAQLLYAANDAGVLLPLYRALDAETQRAGLERAAVIEERCLPALVWMAQRGAPFDVAAWQTLAAAAQCDADRLAAELDQLAPVRPGEFASDWCWDSPAQVKEVFHLLGFEIARTDDDTLAGIDHPLAAKLRDYRAARKGASTYGKDWLKHVDADGRVYPHWRQLGAASGRMSCGDPNMQQLPRGDYRRCIRAAEGRVLVKADYSQIELRIAAKVAGDQAMLSAYQRGEDLHVNTARMVLGVARVSKAERQIGKALGFGLLYGMGARGLQNYAQSNYGVALSDEQAKQYRAVFFKTYPGLAAWHRRTGQSRNTEVETRTLGGRRRREVDRFTEKLNTPVQGTGADGLKAALALLWERRDQVPGAFPVLAVHDEIVVECNIDRADTVAAWLRQAMVDGMAPLIAPVPVEVEVQVARTWGGE